MQLAATGLALAALLTARGVVMAQAPEPPSPLAGDAELHVVLHGAYPFFSDGPVPVIEGETDASQGSQVALTIGGVTHAAEVGEHGRFRLTWPDPLAEGVYTVDAVVTDPRGRRGSTRQGLVVQLAGQLPRRPLLTVPPDYAPPERPASEDFQAETDRWRIVPPAWDLTVKGSRWDPYHQNVLKGDYPIRGQHLFLNLTGVSDTLVEGRTLPTPSGVSARQPGSIEFFGRQGQLFANQNLVVSADLFRGETAFRPIDWRIKATLVANGNFVGVRENAIVKPDVRDGTRRTDGFLALQELFVEKKLADLSPNFDFLSVRAGIQPFSSDFRGFVFTDTNLGVRLFGNLESNRDQYNLAFFDRLEKDTNSGLNTFDGRDQQVAVANFYRQDFLARGYTAEISVVHVRDEATFHFDDNGFLARPDPAGSFTPHEVEVTYFGLAGLGHAGRLNLDHAFYYVTGNDSLNPIAGPEPGGRKGVEVRAAMAALELSLDRDWWRPRLGLFYASGDSDPTDRTARGFDAVLDNPSFAGGAFSFWNRLGIRLAGTGVTLVNRGSLLPDLRSSKEEGQPNFVNPGLLLASLGVDAELTPKLKATATANYLRFDRTETLELVLFQAPIAKSIGWDLSTGLRWRPFLNNNAVLLGGLSAFLPGRGFTDIYEDDTTLWAGFVDLILTF